MKAVIDLGTNTFNITIGEVKKNQLQIALNIEVPVRLGMDGINNNNITPEAMSRGMLALEKFKHYIDEFKITDVYAYATSALRNAKNGSTFVNNVKEKYGISINTISGIEEAELIFKGAFNAFKFPEENVLIMDIGGGSVEFIVAENEEIKFVYSAECGAVRLMQMFDVYDTISATQINLIESYLAKSFKPLLDFVYENPVRMLVGTAGSFDSLTDIVLRDFHTIPVALSKHAYKIERNLFDIFYELMTTSTKLQRQKLKGLVDFRVDTIPIAAVMMQFVMANCNIQQLVASEYALKEGVFFNH
jgi:exopolyphosphatase/guanosine-5'-triphosphate,3'-diphosphate pyrophosphatase